MATKTKKAVAMSTPVNRPAKHQSQRGGFSEAQKQALLEAFDHEVEDRTRNLRANLESKIADFMRLKQSILMQIPKEVRDKTLGELEKKWGGSWQQTQQNFRREVLEAREAEVDPSLEKAKALAEARGKRKRAEEAVAGSSSPSRTNKNGTNFETRDDFNTDFAARRQVPGSAKKTIPLSASKRSLAAKTPRSKTGLTYADAGPSKLPQDHVFNPALPATPGYPRHARRNESFFSANGSPIVLLADKENTRPDIVHIDDAPSDSDDPSQSAHSDDEDDDLPDPEALEAQVLARMGSPKSKPSSRKPKRAPSLMFRQSILPGEGKTVSQIEDGPVELRHIPLSDGRTVTFNPLDLSPGRIDAEMEQGGIGEQEKVKIKMKLQDAVFQALTSRMEKWKVL